MFQSVSRIVVIAAAAVWLAGCGTSNVFSEFKPGAHAADGTDAMAADLPVTTTTTTTTTVADETPPAAAAASALAPVAPADEDVDLGRKYYRVGAFGLAEKHFRHAVEMHPNMVEAWLGLAASYDQLRRFDLADRAYGQALRLAGPNVAIINNQGYSYMMRGDYKMAREKLQLARSKAPDNLYVKNNLQLLAAKTGSKTGSKAKKTAAAQ
jgi:Flp pilus assembly protein TadD